MWHTSIGAGTATIKKVNEQREETEHCREKTSCTRERREAPVLRYILYKAAAACKSTAAKPNVQWWEYKVHASDSKHRMCCGVLDMDEALKWHCEGPFEDTWGVSDSNNPSMSI